MKIGTQFTLATLIFCLIFILIGFSLIYTHNEVNRIGQQQDIARDVVRGAYELSYLSNDYLFHPEEQRQNIQWDSRFAMFSNDVSRLSADTLEQKILVNRIMANKNRLHDVYTQSVVAIEASKTTQGPAADPELIDVAWSRFIVQNQAIIFDASHLSQLLKEESDYLQNINTALIFLLMVFLLLFLLTNTVFIRRRILQSISAINDGTTIIGKGNLDFRLDISHDDEIGDLSVAINQMTANLSKVTSSKFVLEHEISERKKVEDKLREARNNLEIQVQKRTEQLTDANKDLQKEIIERKRADDALRESEKKYHNIFDNAIIGIYQTAPEGHLINANMAMARMLGYENPDDLLAEIHNITEQLYVNPEDRKEVIRIIREHGIMEHFEVPVRHKMGTEIFASVTGRAVKDANGNILFYEGSIVDITKSKRAEEALNKSARYTRNLIEVSLDPLVTISPEGKITDVNAATEQVTGYTRDQLIGTDFSDYFTDIEKAKKGYLKVFDNGVVRDYPLEIRHRDEKITPVMYNATIYRDESGNVLGVFAAARDITERKMAEESLHQANKKLTILSSITRHDITNQLTILMGFLTILQKKQPDPTLTEYFAKVSVAAQRISSMIQFTREYEKIGINAPVWQNCRTLVDTAVKEAPLGKIVVKNDFPAGAEVFADPLVVKVFYNLMDNAVRYGGKITTIRFSVEQRDDDHVMVCEDDGDGVVVEEKEKIFDRGFGKNTGLGLALSREILDITGITIKETGEPGKGARFEMTVPKGAWRLGMH